MRETMRTGRDWTCVGHAALEAQNRGPRQWLGALSDLWFCALPPLRPRCNVSGQPLSLSEFRRCRVRASTYPYYSAGDCETEVPVTWLCRSCEEQAVVWRESARLWRAAQSPRFRRSAAQMRADFEGCPADELEALDLWLSSEARTLPALPAPSPDSE